MIATRTSTIRALATLVFIVSPLISTAELISDKKIVYQGGTGGGFAVEEFNSAEGLRAARNDLEGITASVSDGQLHISYQGNGQYFIPNSRDLATDLLSHLFKNFELTATLLRPLSAENWDDFNLTKGFHSYGIYWGYRDDENYKMVLINLGRFSVGKVENGEWTGMDWEYGETALDPAQQEELLASFFKFEGSTLIKVDDMNQIRVQQRGGLLKAFINDKEIFSTEDSGYIGDLGDFGVLMQQSGSMTIDRFTYESWGEPADMTQAEAALQAGDVDLALTHIWPLADEGNDAFAQARLGQMYLEGVGLTRDFKQGLSWLEKSAAQDNDTGQLTLGLALATGPVEIQDFPAARSWLLKGLQGVTEQPTLHQRNAAFILGTMLAGGNGGPQDYVEARRWLELAAGPPEPLRMALSALGEFSLNGYGGDRDVEKAQQLFLRAVKMGEPAAAVQLGMMYGNGTGVEQNLMESYKWFSVGFQASPAGPAKDYVKNLLAQFESALTPDQRKAAEDAAVAWMSEQL